MNSILLAASAILFPAVVRASIPQISFDLKVTQGHNVTSFVIRSEASKVFYDAKNEHKHKTGQVAGEDVKFLKRKINEIVAVERTPQTQCGRSSIVLVVKHPHPSSLRICLESVSSDKDPRAKNIKELANGLSLLLR